MQAVPREASRSNPGLAKSKRTRHAERRSDLETRRSEERLRLALEAAGTGTFLWSADTDRVEANAQLLKLCDLPSDAAATSSLTAALRERIHPEDRARYDESWALATDPAGSGAFGNEFRVVHRNGEVRWLLFTGQIFFEGVPPRAVGSVGTAADITERRRAEQELREADRRKDEFLAILAHELRNPLAPLRNALEVMKLAPGDSRQFVQSREIMDRQLTHMARLIDDLLDVSRISRGKLNLRRARVELEPIIRQAVETSQHLIAAASHRLTIAMPRDPLLIDGDPARLGQVFSNLLNNAAKYTEQGGQISLFIERREDRAVVRVRDTGIGIPVEMLSRVFDMFLQIDRSLEKAQGGLGVGLSLVKGLVELHGGTVEARSEGLGRGSEFVVQLPLASVLTTRPGRHARTELTAATDRRRILVVDDNADAASSLAMVLESLKYETRVAFDGFAALDAASEFRPSVVLLDIGMPNLNGYEACRRLRKKPWGRNMVIVALTGWGRAPDQVRSKTAGFDFHLVKPVDPALLSRLLASLPPSATSSAS